MFQTSEAIERFFRTFELNSSSDDINSVVLQFGEVFMAAGPQGVQAVRAADFALALPRKKQMFESLGHQSTELVALREERLDARFILAATRWKMSFAHDQTPLRTIEVDSVYIVDTGADDPKIVFYLANQDLMQVLKDRGIQPR